MDTSCSSSSVVISRDCDVIKFLPILSPSDVSLAISLSSWSRMSSITCTILLTNVSDALVSSIGFDFYHSIKFRVTRLLIDTYRYTLRFLDCFFKYQQLAPAILIEEVYSKSLVCIQVFRDWNLSIGIW